MSSRTLRLAIAGIALASIAGAVSGAELRQLRVSVIVDDPALAAVADEAMQSAAFIYRQQFNIELIATHREVARVAEHEHAQFLLDALKVYRVDSGGHRAAGATVLFTARNLRIGNQRLAGFATTGPACSASASAIVKSAGNHLEGATLAHELAHTLGVDHDHTPGWIMSETQGYAETFSPQSVQQVAGITGDCFMKPAGAATAAEVTASPTGGGGAFGWVFSLCLLALRAGRRA